MGRGKQRKEFVGKERKSPGQEVVGKGWKRPGQKQIKSFTEKDMDDEVDVFHKQRDKVSLDINDDEDASDEDLEQPVFDLKGESSEESEELESDDDEQLTGLAAKIAKQAKFLRQKSGGVEDEMEEEADEKEEERKAAWGKGKKLYYSADNIDYEIQSSDEELPAVEEAEVLRLQRKKAESFRPEDFGLDEDEEDESNVDSDVHEETLQEAVKRHEGGLERKKSKKTSDRELGKDVDDGKIVAFEEVKKDINALTKEQQMEVVMSDAPELVGLLSEFKDGLDNLKIVQLLLQKVKGNKNVTKEGMSYLEVKQLLLLCYCQSIVFYLLLKAEGRSVRDHPVIARLVEIRDFLDKIRPIDNRLENQFESLLKEENTDSIEGAPAKTAVDFISAEDVMSEFKIATSVVKSKSDQLVQDGDSRIILVTGSVMEANNVGNLSSEDKEAKEMVGAESKEMLKQRAKLEAYMKQLKDGFSQVVHEKPERKTLKHLKRARNGLLETLEDFDDDVADLSTIKGDKSRDLDGLQQPRKISQLITEAGRIVKKPKLISGDDNLPEREDLGERRKRHEMLKSGMSPSPDDRSEEEMEDDPEGSEDEFYREVKQKRAANLAAKAEIYSRKLMVPDPEEEIDGKRQITYQMEKNKGLTPHRKKLTKIPRKRYKMKHEKAVKRRKGQVRDVKSSQGPYGGETTGIRTAISRSIRFKN